MVSKKTKNVSICHAECGVSLFIDVWQKRALSLQMDERRYMTGASFEDWEGETKKFDREFGSFINNGIPADMSALDFLNEQLKDLEIDYPCFENNN